MSSGLGVNGQGRTTKGAVGLPHSQNEIKKKTDFVGMMLLNFLRDFLSAKISH
jgi:hypothetical protein